jgi:antitoxin ParD1/3/4
MHISISLTPELLRYIKTKVATGRYASVSEVVREALRVLERIDQRQSESRIQIRQAWNEGLASEDLGPLDFAELKAAARSRLAASSKK